MIEKISDWEIELEIFNFIENKVAMITGIKIITILSIEKYAGIIAW